MSDQARLPAQSTRFEVPVKSKAIETAAERAFAAALDADSRKTIDSDTRGAVFCQLIRGYDGKITLKGAFIEREWAEKIQRILAQRLKKLGQQGTEDFGKRNKA